MIGNAATRLNNNFGRTTAFRSNVLSSALISIIALTPAFSVAAEVVENEQDNNKVVNASENNVESVVEIAQAADANNPADVNALIEESPTGAGEITILAFNTLTLDQVHDRPISQSIIP